MRARHRAHLNITLEKSVSRVVKNSRSMHGKEMFCISLRLSCTHSLTLFTITPMYNAYVHIHVSLTTFVFQSNQYYIVGSSFCFGSVFLSLSPSVHVVRNFRIHVLVVVAFFFLRILISFFTFDAEGLCISLGIRCIFDVIEKCVIFLFLLLLLFMNKNQSCTCAGQDRTHTRKPQLTFSSIRFFLLRANLQFS